MQIRRGDADRREELFGGRGAVQVWNLLGATRAPPFTAVLSCELDPGGSVGAHVQEHSHEIVIGLEGEGIVRVGDASHPLRPGAVVYLELGQTLALRNDSGAAPMRYLIVKARS